MIANFSWKSANSSSGIVGDRRGCGASPTPRNMKKVSGLPTMPVDAVAEREAEARPTIHSTLTTPSAMKLWSIVEMTFFGGTMPP